MPAAFFLQEASPDRSLHSNSSQVTGENDAQLRLVELSSGRGGVMTVARVNPREKYGGKFPCCSEPCRRVACCLHLQIPVNVCGI